MDASELHLLGIKALQSGQLTSAVDLIQRSLAADPHQPLAHANLAVALQSLNRFDEALVACDHAIQLAPTHAPAHYNRGAALWALQRPCEAIDSFDRALQLKPDYFQALHNRGSILARLNRPQEALESYDHALRLVPNLAETLNNRGMVLEMLSQPAAALESYESALRLKPGFVEALINRGDALRTLGRLVESLESYEQALASRPQSAQAANGRGQALLSLLRGPEALASFDAALRLRPDFPDALHNRGNALRLLRRMDEALASFERSIQLGEKRPEALANYGWALLESQRYEAAALQFAQVVGLEPASKYVLGAMLLAHAMCCDWTQYDATVAAALASVRADELLTSPFILMAVSDDPEVQFRCVRAFAADRFPSEPPAWRGQRYSHDRIRVAYVSGDLRDHVVSRLLAPLIERHDREQFEIIGVSVRPPEDTPFGQRIRAAFDQFHDVSFLGDAQIAARLCELEVDIAVDLGGSTGSQRPGIFARRPAPVQVNYLGYPGTLGADYFHYIVADATIVPLESRKHYSEQVVYLPDCYQANHAERALPDPGLTREQYGLPATGLVLCCFNNSFKLIPAVFDIWMRVLGAVEDSVLWLAGHRPSVVQNLRAAAAEQDVDPERLIFAEHLPSVEAHLARYALADLFLDTYPFNAHATASDALWHAVPVVTCIGNAFAGRVGASLFHGVGLPELVTHDLEEYEAKILELARNPALLADLRSRLGRNRATCSLFDTDRLRRHLEAAYRTMWERQQRGAPPESFAVPTISAGR